MAVLGLAFFVGMVILSLPPIYRRAERVIAFVRLGSAIVGIGFVLYLVYAELFLIHAICLWCSSVHTRSTFIIFCLVVSGWPESLAATTTTRPTRTVGSDHSGAQVYLAQAASRQGFG